jgi:LCP family protein required for cell wall assembly
MAAPTVVASAAPSDPGPQSSARHFPRRRSRWPKRVLIGLNVFVGLCLIASASLYGYVSYRFGQIKHISIGDLFKPAAVVGGSGPAGPPMNILVVGSDTRALSAADHNQFGSGALVGGQRSDTIMLVHLNPIAGTASLLSIPRDTWVPIPGHGTNRINSAFDYGADLLVRTIQDNFGVAINHYVEVNFDSFRQVVNALNGVKFWYPEPVRDNDNGVNDSGLNITTPGCYTLSGDMALSLVRTRHLQYFSNGSWHFEAESDLARIRRQQAFVKKVISKAESTIDITKLNGVVGGIMSNITVDSGFSQRQLVALARRYRSFNASTLPTATLPTNPSSVFAFGGRQSVLLPLHDQDQAAIAAWEGATATGSTPTTLPPGAAAVSLSNVSVGVLNGTGVSHQAATAVNALRAAGIPASVSGSASHFGYPTTVIEYAPGDLASAQALEAHVTGGADLQPDSTLTPGHLLLITGSTYGGISGSAGPTVGATATTAAPVIGTTPTTAAPKPLFPGSHGADPPPPGSGC